MMVAGSPPPAPRRFSFQRTQAKFKFTKSKSFEHQLAPNGAAGAYSALRLLVRRLVESIMSDFTDYSGF
jgi:hypothetical protein